MSESLCKVCNLLSEMKKPNARRLNDAILSRQIDAETATELFTKHLTKVAASTVKKHRKAEHRV
jgi:hypothetical protein